MSNRAVRVAWPALTFLVATAALVVVLTAQGDDGHAALATGRPFVHLVLALAAAAALGLLVAAVGEPDDRRRSALLDAAAIAAGVQAVAAALIAVLLYLVDAPAVSAAAFGPGLVTFVLELPVGRAWLAAAVAAAVVSAVVVAARSRRGAAVALGLALLSLIPVALHASTSGDSLAAARTAVVAGGLRLAGTALVVGVLAVSRGGSALTRWTALGGAVLAGTGAASTALLRLGEGSGALLLVDAGILALGAVAAAAAVVLAPRPRAAAGRVQLLLTAVALGVGSAPAITDPVLASVAARTSPAQILTGESLPPVPGVAALLGTWRADPLLLLVCGALLAGYAVGVARAGRDMAPARVGSWVAGVLVLLWATCGGLAVLAPVLLPAFLAQHLVLLLVVPLLLAGGGPVALLGRAVPSGALPRSPGLHRLSDPRLVGPVVAVLLVMLIDTGALRWSVADPVGAPLVDLLLLAAGALLVHGTMRRGSLAVPVLVGLLAVEVAGGAALLLSPGLLQSDWFGAMGWGTDALAAQRSAGVIGLAVAVPATAVLLAVPVVRRTRAARTPAAPLLVRAGGADA